jgi:hypothetical protein
MNARSVAVRKRIEIFCEMSTLAGLMSGLRREYGSNSPQLQDAAREMNHLRGELCRAQGVAERDISADGYDISQRSYERVRDRWIEELSAPWATGWYLNAARKAHARWVELRPDLAKDDWFAGAANLDLDSEA